ncbi:MAG: 3-deoxy-manno-octulosonate cytidylyltransferase [Deltaproteobacteria bacterium]|nr:3-deoxy-manno-octulosonate cytidylyltransferase [Deltaproteobacteria bacterium]
MRSVVVIPARYGSTRFPGKPLADICGRPMIWHVYTRALQADRVQDVIVATDDERILDVILSLGGRCVMTPSDIRSGTDRVRHVVSGKAWDVVINLQGDEPLIDPSIIDRLAELFEKDEGVQIATAAVKSTSPEDFLRPDVVKVVIAKSGKALYFSRSPIPHPREKNFRFFYRHIGLYAFRRSVLEALEGKGESVLEDTESLEQLKWMDYGYGIRVLEVDYEPVAVDTPDDLAIVRKKMLQVEGSRET